MMPDNRKKNRGGLNFAPVLRGFKYTIYWDRIIEGANETIKRDKGKLKQELTDRNITVISSAGVMKDMNDILVAINSSVRPY